MFKGIEQVYAVGVLDQLEAVIDQLCDAGSEALSGAESIEVLHRCLARLEAVTTGATAAFEAGGAWQATGARTAAAWVSRRCGVPLGEAKRRTRLGRSLRHLPVAEAAWRAGQVHQAHVAALAGARTPTTEVALARDEALLVNQATSLRYDHFRRALAYWCQRADPDGVEEAARDLADRRGFHLSQSIGGLWLGDVVLDPIGGAVVSNQLGRIDKELFEADWAEARSRKGDAATVSDLARTPTQRRADALVEMARRAGTAPAGGRRPEPLFTVLVGYESFAGRICELADGTVVSPGQLVDWLDQAWIERVVFDGPSRVIDVGVARRLFSGATRRAVLVRDQECFHEFCDVPAEACQVDHIEPWAAGGATDQRNGRPACGHHNRGRHRPPDPPPEE